MRSIRPPGAPDPGADDTHTCTFTWDDGTAAQQQKAYDFLARTTPELNMLVSFLNETLTRFLPRATSPPPLVVDAPAPRRGSSGTSARAPPRTAGDVRAPADPRRTDTGRESDTPLATALARERCRESPRGVDIPTRGHVAKNVGQLPDRRRVQHGIGHRRHAGHGHGGGVILHRVIEWSVANRWIVLVLAAFVVAAGIVAMRGTRLEALPDRRAALYKVDENGVPRVQIISLSLVGR